jgi:hypothetical protein
MQPVKFPVQSVVRTLEVIEFRSDCLDEGLGRRMHVLVGHKFPGGYFSWEIVNEGDYGDYSQGA